MDRVSAAAGSGYRRGGGRATGRGDPRRRSPRSPGSRPAVPEARSTAGTPMRITLCGAAGEVTGSGYLVETARARVLVDFGLFQGRGATDATNRDLGPVEPKRLDAVVLTHAHL